MTSLWNWDAREGAVSGMRVLNKMEYGPKWLDNCLDPILKEAKQLLMAAEKMFY